MRNLNGSIKIVCFIISFWILLCSTTVTIYCQQKIDYLKLPVIDSVEKIIDSIDIEVYCSDQKPRTVVSTLKWSADSEKMESLRIDVTVFYRGFEKNLFHVMWPIQKGQRFQSSPLSDQPIRPNETSLNLMVNKISIDSVRNIISSEFEGFESGLIYYFRFCLLSKNEWIPGENIRIEAPICPVDFIEEE
jgi:hypothetical protein